MGIELPFSTEIFVCQLSLDHGKNIVYRTLATHIIKKAGYTKQTAQAGVVTMIQRFGSVLT